MQAPKATGRLYDGSLSSRLALLILAIVAFSVWMERTVEIGFLNIRIEGVHPPLIETKKDEQH